MLISAYENYFFDEAGSYLDSKIGEAIPDSHSPISNGKPVSNDKITTKWTPSMDRALKQQHFKA